ncbi:hypothetical protein JK628_04200 [Shewanella sp. KX20019]|nr:hypothetical protein [Shewanella sp. KX20019]QQX81082.1 hypothetical protein JK628_04200 [Shewanella sp. KX20019]
MLLTINGWLGWMFHALEAELTVTGKLETSYLVCWGKHFKMWAQGKI